MLKKRLLWLGFVVSVFPLAIASALGSEILLTPKTTLKFADAKEAAVELMRKDSFIELLSPFDRSARKKTDKPVSQADFLKFVSEQALPWQSAEIDKLTRILGSISNKIEGLRLNLPASIQFIKTTGREEGGAAYCRGNTVVLPAHKTASSDGTLERLLTHEFFHILSRNDRKLRDAFYAIVGFKPCGVVAYPKELEPRRITNPDAPVVEHYLAVAVQEKPVFVAPILFSNAEKYEVKKGGEFFAYLTFKLLAIEERGSQWIPVYQQGKLRLLDVDEVQGFYEQIGRNTDYILHPEEVLADNFVLLVQGDKDMASPKILSEMRRVLSSATPSN